MKKDEFCPLAQEVLGGTSLDQHLTDIGANEFRREDVDVQHFDPAKPYRGNIEREAQLVADLRDYCGIDAIDDILLHKRPFAVAVVKLQSNKYWPKLVKAAVEQVQAGDATEVELFVAAIASGRRDLLKAAGHRLRG